MAGMAQEGLGLECRVASQPVLALTRVVRCEQDPRVAVPLPGTAGFRLEPRRQSQSGQYAAIQKQVGLQTNVRHQPDSWARTLRGCLSKGQASYSRPRQCTLLRVSATGVSDAQGRWVYTRRLAEGVGCMRTIRQPVVHSSPV